MSAPLPGLAFELEGARLTLYFSADFNWMAAHLDGSRLAGRSHRTVSTRPIAEGLAKYFAEALP
jgi:hypothetical protein